MKGVKQLIIGLACLSGMLLGVAPQASALTFGFDWCSFSGGACSGSGPFGTVAITDNGANAVQVVINATPPSSTNGGGNYGNFDLAVQFTGQGANTPVTFNFNLTGTGLTSNAFNTANDGGIFAALYVGNTNSGGSSWVVGGDGKSLPLPATMLLMGASFLGLGLIRRFQK